MNDELLQELKNFVAEQVGAVSAEVQALRQDMDANFEKQQRHIDNRFNVVEKQIHELRTDVVDMHSKFSGLQSSVDHYVVRAERLADEQLAMVSAMRRYERWFKQLAEATEVKLESAA